MTTDLKPPRTRRLILALAALAVAGGSAFVVWWLTTLNGLPDVGDPFDIQAFARSIPDETNAFVLYKKAAAILPDEPETNANYDWKTAVQKQRDWIEKSREAFAIWRLGTDRPDAANVDAATVTFRTTLDVSQKLRSFSRMALVEGSRLEDQGDFEGALELYLAVLRSSRHCGQHGMFIERLIGMAMHRWVSTRLIRWSADPKVDAKMLRRALEAAIVAGAATPPPSHALKMEYLTLVHSIDDPEVMVPMLDQLTQTHSTGSQPGITLANDGLRTSLIRIQRRALSEPERSRRVLRMIFANWLAYADLPLAQRPPKVVPSPGQTLTGPASAILGELYVAGDDAPDAARALPPEKLAQWFASTYDARICLPAYLAFEKAISRERSAQDALLYNLANELYKREHGQYPEHNEDLVGPYLKVLPPGYGSSR